MNSGSSASKKQKTVVQAGSPEWPIYFHEVHNYPFPKILRPIERSLVVQGALPCIVRLHSLTALPLHRSRCTRYVCVSVWQAHRLDPG